MLGSSEEEHPGDCRLCAQSLVTAVLPGRVGHCGPAVPSVVSVSGRLAGPAREPQPIDRRQLIEKSIPLQKKLFALAEAHLDDADREVRNMATALFIHFERLFTFLEEEGVEPTNNVAEQDLAHGRAVAQDQLRQPQPQRAKSPRPAYSLSRRPARGSSGTYWATSLTQYAAIAVRLRHLPCSRSGTDHLNCYGAAGARPFPPAILKREPSGTSQLRPEETRAPGDFPTPATPSAGANIQGVAFFCCWPCIRII